MTGKTKKWLRIRILTLFSVITLLFVVLVARAFQLQILSQKTLKPLAAKQHTKSIQLQPDRGLIMDRNGEKLAISIQMDSVCAEPNRIVNPRKTAELLASILGLDVPELEKKLSSRKGFCWVSRMVSPSQSSAVKALDIEGVYLLKEPKRFYPNQQLAGPILGLVGLDASGLEGIELKYDDYLKREPENVLWGRDAKGHKLFLKDNLTKEKTDCDYNILLTIDSRIQYLVETQLKEAVESKIAHGGVAVVVDPRTGEVLAMAQQPAFNPNILTKVSQEGKKNRSIADVFDPGSTFKPFTVAAAMEERIIKEQDRIFCENGAYRIANRVIHDAQHERFGFLTVRDVLKHSSNIGTAKIAQKLGKEKFYQYVKDFGFGGRTGIDLPGEVSGLLRPVNQWTTVDQATIAFGQGVSVTAMQLVSAFSALANKGVLMKPYIVKGIVDQQNRMVRDFKPTVVRQVISAPTAMKMATMLTDVVIDGTGKSARIMNVSVAGKTGTAQKYDAAARRYSSEKVRASFIGFFPAEDPRVVIFVMIDEPQRDKWGGVAAAPVFRNIGEQILRCYDGNAADVFNANAEDKAPQPEVAANRSAIKFVSTLPEVMPESVADESLMPDFRGMSMKRVLKLSRDHGIALNAVGSGWAIRQDPSPGVPLAEHPACTVVFSTGNN